MNRHQLYATYASRLLVENAEQLTNNYNRTLNNVRTIFPDFNLVHSIHHPFFGGGAIVSCHLRKCTDDEIERYHLQDDPFSHLVPGERLEQGNNDLKEFYDTEFVDTIQAKAKETSSWGTSLLSKGLQLMLAYGYYTGNGYYSINTLLRSNKTTKPTIDAMVKQFTRFGQTLLLPFYTEKDLVLYRGDGQTISSEIFTTRGLYSTSLSVTQVGGFAKDG